LETAKIRSVIEGLLYLTGEEGLTIKQIRGVLSDCPEQAIRRIIDKMKDDYRDDASRGVMITDIPGGWRMTTKPFMARYAQKFATVPKATPLSQAALETVAIVAYKQPVSRITIEEIRGVKSERALQTLTAKGLITEVGRAGGAGRAILYGVTSAFLDYFGLTSLDELPPLSDASSGQSADTYDLFYDKYKETVKNR
jgi:segregation and condensation protein B